MTINDAPWPSGRPAIPAAVPPTPLIAYVPLPGTSAAGIVARYVRYAPPLLTFQHPRWAEPPISVPVRATPSNTTLTSGPPIVCQTRYAARTRPFCGMPVMISEPLLGAVPGFWLAGVRRARPTPSATTPPLARPSQLVATRSPLWARSAAAENTRMRSRVICGLASPSVTGLPVRSNASWTAATLAVDPTWRAIAHAPATCGAAIEVPLNDVKPPPGTDELTFSPGAKKSTSELEFEKVGT